MDWISLWYRSGYCVQLNSILDRFGIRVQFSAVLEGADLLTMTRANNVPIDLSSYTCL